MCGPHHWGGRRPKSEWQLISYSSVCSERSARSVPCWSETHPPLSLSPLLSHFLSLLSSCLPSLPLSPSLHLSPLLSLSSLLSTSLSFSPSLPFSLSPPLSRQRKGNTGRVHLSRRYLREESGKFKRMKSSRIASSLKLLLPKKCCLFPERLLVEPEI